MEKALSIGFFYAALLVLVLYLVQKSVIVKLKVFSPFQQWVLRTFIYTITISSVYLTGLLFQSFLLTPNISLTQVLSERFWSSFVTFISSPLDLQFADDLLREEFRTILISANSPTLIRVKLSRIGLEKCVLPAIKLIAPPTEAR